MSDDDPGRTYTADCVENPIDDGAGVEFVRERSEPRVKSMGRSSTADIRESARGSTP